MIRLLVIATILCASGVARAQSATTVMFNGMAGGEILGGHGAYSSAFRANGAINATLGSGTRRPMLGVGATFGAGDLCVDDARATDGCVNLSFASWGPEAQIGLRFGHSRYVDNRLYLSAAAVRTNVDSRVALDAVPGVMSGWGLRAALGASWTGTFVEGPDTDSGDDDPLGEMLYWVVPTQFQIVYERDAGSDRVGGFVGWGL